MVRASDELGRYGENIAAAHLEAAGLEVVQRNWRCREGEIDIVARDGTTVVVCEVKTRAGLGFGSPLEAVTAPKLRRLRRLAAVWMTDNTPTWARAVRIDVVGIVYPPGGEPVIDHVRDVVL
ncbi:MAG: putative endonuclease [Frankiales bacterium]|nr:putative endonuclease [Frankiales bacterium]